MLGKYDAQNPQALQPFPTAVMEACYKSANEIYVGLNQSNPLFKKMHDSVASFRSDSYQWMQVAELSYDSFMMRQRTRT